MGMVMMTIQAESRPTLEGIRQRYGLAEVDLDTHFGIIEVDPDEGLYTFMVDEQRAKAVGARAAEHFSGPYSNPRISTFGPPRS